MSSAKENKHIARLIVGAMSIDGSMDEKELKKCAATLNEIGMGQLVAEVGIALDEVDSNFNVFQECRDLVQSLGSNSRELSPLIYRIVVDVVASDRFVSMREASYLAAIAKRLDLEWEEAQNIFKKEMARRRGRLEISGTQIDEAINKNLKELLSFSGSDELVGELDEDSLEEMLHQAEAGADVSQDDVARAMTILGLKSNAKLEDAEKVWLETINNLNLPKLAEIGETFVSAAIDRVTAINNAYKTILAFFKK